jgi:hypothetical protein
MLHARSMHAACTQHARSMHVACTQHARSMHAACTQHARSVHACIVMQSCISHSMHIPYCIACTGRTRASHCAQGTRSVAWAAHHSGSEPSATAYADLWGCGERGVRLAQKMQVRPCIPVKTQLQNAEVGPTSGPAWRLSHSRPL